MNITQSINAIIVEDEQSAVNRLQKELKLLENVMFDFQEIFESVSDTVDWLKKGYQVDLIFMDIHLVDGLSFEIFNQAEVHCPVIFTTAYDEYALQAFKANGIDYLLKPINPEDLSTAINRYLRVHRGIKQEDYLNRILQVASEYRPDRFRSRFLVSVRQKMLLIDVSEVAYVYVRERGVFLKKKDGMDYALDFFLDSLEKQLDPSQFYRANRQFLISRSSIKEIEPYFNGRVMLVVQPEAYTPVIVSKEKATHFKRWADY
jgi:DNA-binding LytR/AlgR family response regulator